METHSKHGESIWWQAGDRLIVNRFIPSRLDWQARGATVVMETAYPYDAAVTLTLEELASPSAFAVALRLQGWCEGAALAVNVTPQPTPLGQGPAVVPRRLSRCARPRIPAPKPPPPNA